MTGVNLVKYQSPKVPLPEALDALISWLKRQPKTARFTYSDRHTCMAAQYQASRHQRYEVSVWSSETPISEQSFEQILEWVGAACKRDACGRCSFTEALMVAKVTRSHLGWKPVDLYQLLP